MDRPPKKPGPKAGENAWEVYWSELNDWQNRNQSLGTPAVENTVYSTHRVRDKGPNVKAEYNPDTGITKNYYGGYEEADDEWHGHSDVDENGNVIHPDGGRPAGQKRNKRWNRE